MLEAVRLRWQVDKAGYELGVRPTRCIPKWNRRVNPLGICIKPRTYEFRTREIGLGHSTFIDLANAEETPEGALAFAGNWGGLRGTLLHLEDFYEGRLAIRSAIEARKSGATALIRHFQAPPVADLMDGGKFYPFRDGLGSLDTCFEKGKLFFEAQNLLQFCMLQLVHDTSGGVGISQCGACGAYLHLPKTGRPKVYCGDACKQDAYRQRHKHSSRQAGAVIVRKHSRLRTARKARAL
jgi:hypothetical protein